MANILESLVDYLKPKGHDAIDSLIAEAGGPSNEEIMNLVMGSVGGGGPNISKAAKEILTKILSRNAKGIFNLRPNAPRQGWQSLDQSNLPRGVLPGKPPASSVSQSAPEFESFIALLMAGLGGLKADAISRRKYGKGYGEGVGSLNIGLPSKQH